MNRPPTPLNLPSWAVDFDTRLRSVEDEAKAGKGASLAAYAMSEEARDAARAAVDAVHRIERCITGQGRGLSHDRLDEKIDKALRQIARLQGEAKARGVRGSSVEDSTITRIAPGIVPDPASLRGSWRIRFPQGKALVWKIVQLAGAGGLVELAHRLGLFGK